jgi:hypothetical protein
VEHSKADHLTVPLSFEPNQGQTAATVQFISRGSGYALFLESGEVVLNLERQQPAPATATGQTPEAASVDTLRMSLIGGNAKAKGVGLAPQPGVVSYFIGNDPKNWRSGIPTYGKVNYAQVYPGVDLVFYGNQRQLEYDFVVAPGADPSRIAWRIDGARARVDAEGNLVLSASNGPASFKKPVLYQMDGDKRTSVEGAFAVTGNQVRFQVGSYDHSRALIVDPILSYASYLAGSATDHIGLATGPGIAQVGVSQGLAVDSAGSVYVAGYTYSLDFPTKNPYESAPPAKQFGGANVPPGQWPSAFVTKFSPDGSSLVYSTYLGGNNYDYIYAIAVDSSGSAYVTGETNSTSFPVTPGAYQTICDPAPSNQGPPYTASCNSSNVSAFVTKLNPTGTGIVYSTFLGGYAYAYATAIAVDSAGRAYIAGNETEYCSTYYTFQSCFPTTSGAVIGGNSTGGRSPQYAFVAAFDPTGGQLLYSTFFGDLNGFGCLNGCGATWGTGVAVDNSGNFYLIGETMAGKLPTTAGVIQPVGVPLDPTNGVYVTAWRGFVAKFNPVTSAGGASLAYATYLGGKTGNTGDYISGIAIDNASNAYIVGYTNSKDFPVTAGAYQTVCGLGGGTCAAAHVTKLNPTGSAILWSTFVGDAKVGGSDALFFTGPIQLDGNGNVYIMGQSAGGFPLVNPVEPNPTGGDMELVVAELDPTGANLLFSTYIGSGGRDTANPAGLAVDSAGTVYLAGNNAGPDLITTPGAFQTTSANSGCCYHGFVVKIAPTAFLTPPLSAQAASVAASAGGGSVQVNAAAGSAWLAFSNAAWITITNGASGSGSGVVSFTIAANSGGARSGTIDIGGQTFTIYQESGSASGLSFAGSMPQVASAGGWDTSLTVVNLGSTPGEARLNFFGDSGGSPWLPFTYTQQPAAGTTLGATFDETLAAGASFLLDTTGPVTQTNAEGWSQLMTSGDINGFAIFTYTPNGQAATVPLDRRNAASYLLAFENTGAVSTGLAIANLAASAANVNVVIRDDTGAQIGQGGSINLPALGHTSFMLTDPTYGFPKTANVRGTVEFDTPQGGQISVMGLRANAIPNSSGFAVTSLPALAGVGTGGGTFPHFVSSGGWQTTFTLVNTGSTAATVNLSFIGDSGSAVSLPLSFPQTGTVSTASSVNKSIPAGGSLMVVAQDLGGPITTSGSAVFTTTGNVGGFAVFRYDPTGQEAVVPLQAANAPSYILVFDNTGILLTGLAIANFAAQPANVSVIMRNDTGAQIGTGSISLPAHGHTSFMLTDTSNGGWAFTANMRGTVEFVTPSGGQIAPLGLRAAMIPGGFTITTIPVMTK